MFIRDNFTLPQANTILMEIKVPTHSITAPSNKLSLLYIKHCPAVKICLQLQLSSWTQQRDTVEFISTEIPLLPCYQ